MVSFSEVYELAFLRQDSDELVFLVLVGKLFSRAIAECCCNLELRF